MPRRPGGGKALPARSKLGCVTWQRDAGPDVRQLSRGDTENFRGLMLAASTPPDWPGDVKADAILRSIFAGKPPRWQPSGCLLTGRSTGWAFPMAPLSRRSSRSTGPTFSTASPADAASRPSPTDGFPRMLRSIDTKRLPGILATLPPRWRYLRSPAAALQGRFGTYPWREIGDFAILSYSRRR